MTVAMVALGTPMVVATTCSPVPTVLYCLDCVESTVAAAAGEKALKANTWAAGAPGVNGVCVAEVVEVWAAAEDPTIAPVAAAPMVSTIPPAADVDALSVNVTVDGSDAAVWL